MGTPLSPVTVPEVFRSFSFLKWPLLTKGFIAGDSTPYNSHTLPGDSPYYPWRAHRKLRDANLWGGNLDPLITLRTLFWYSWSVYNLNNKRPGKRKENITIFIFIEFTTVTGDETGLTSQQNMKPFNIHPTHKRLYHTNGDYAFYSLRTAIRVLLRRTRIRTVKELWDGAYGFWSSPEKTRMANNL